jgi:hypothetical protein
VTPGSGSRDLCDGGVRAVGLVNNAHAELLHVKLSGCRDVRGEDECTYWTSKAPDAGLL